MQTGDGRLTAWAWLKDHTVEVAFSLFAAGWFWYVVRLYRGFYFWADDLPVLQQAGSWDRLLEPYKGALSLVLLLVYRAAAELGHLSYTPFTVAFAVALVRGPHQLLLHHPEPFRSAARCDPLDPPAVDHGHLVETRHPRSPAPLVGGIVSAAALNRGRRG